MSDILDRVLELTDDTYADVVVKSDAVIFIDFYSDFCGPCRVVLTYLEGLAKHFEGEKVIIAKMNVDDNPKIADILNVTHIPYIVVIGKDKTIKRARTGVLSLNGYIKMIDKTLHTETFFSKMMGKLKG